LSVSLHACLSAILLVCYPACLLGCMSAGLLVFYPLCL
jgi:hypothetical protein